MNFNDLTNSVSQSESIPAGKVRKVAKAFFEQLNEAIDSGEIVRVPGLVFKTKLVPAREAAGEKPARAEFKRLTVKRKAEKPGNPESAGNSSANENDSFAA